MRALFVLLFAAGLIGCYEPDKDLPFELKMIVKEWDRLEDPHSKEKAKCFTKCDDQPVDCFYSCSDSKEGPQAS